MLEVSGITDVCALAVVTYIAMYVCMLVVLTHELTKLVCKWHASIGTKLGKIVCFTSLKILLIF